MNYLKPSVITGVAMLAFTAFPTLLLANSGSPIPGKDVDAQELRIVVIDGEDGVNVLKKKTAVRPVVEIRDKNNLPIAGATVVFFLPRGGASAKFASGAKEFSVLTDASGRATSAALEPVKKGTFQIGVRASYQGQTASTSITQTNFANAAQAYKAGKTPGSSTHAAESAANGTTETASGGASSASTAAGASSAAAGAGGGLSAGAVAGIVGGVAAAGAGAGLAVTHKNSESKQDCTSFLSAAQADLNAEISACSVVTPSALTGCRNAAQKTIDDIGRYCSCSSETIPANLRQQILQINQIAGLTMPSSCGF